MQTMETTTTISDNSTFVQAQQGIDNLAVGLAIVVFSIVGLIWLYNKVKQLHLFDKIKKKDAKEQMLHFGNAVEQIAEQKPVEPPKLAPDWWDSIMYYFTHIMVVGSTGAGKSTFVKGMLYQLSRYGKVVIIDPHIRFHWPIDTIGYGLNFAAISYSFDYLINEMMFRFKRANEDKDYKPEHLYIVVDEFPAIYSELGANATNFISKLAQQGRKVNMHLILLTQSDLVKAIGLEGNGKVRDNFITIYLGLEATQLCKEYYEIKNNEEWPCVFNIGKENYPVNRDFVYTLSQRKINAKCAFVIPGLPIRQDSEVLALLEGAKEDVIEYVLEQKEFKGNLSEVVRAAMLIQAHKEDATFTLTEFSKVMGFAKNINKGKSLLAKIYDLTGVSFPAYLKTLNPKV
jgi:hypothetical protein